MDSGADRDLLNLYMNATECDVDEFCEQALEVLKKHLPFDSAIVVEGYKNKGESPVAGSLHLHNQPIEKWYDYQSFRGLDPIASVAASHPGKTFAQDVSFIPKTSKFSRFCDYMKRYEVSHALLT